MLAFFYDAYMADKHRVVATNFGNQNFDELFCCLRTCSEGIGVCLFAGKQRNFEAHIFFNVKKHITIK